MNELRVLFGKRLKKIRIDANLTQEQLAEKIQVSPDFISLIERGERSPSLETIAKIASALNKDISELFRFDDEEKKPTMSKG